MQVSGTRRRYQTSILLFHIPIPWLSLPPGWAIIVISTVVAWALSGSVADVALDPLAQGESAPPQVPVLRHR